MPNTLGERMLADEIGPDYFDNRLYKLLRAAMESSQCDNLEAIAIARAVDLAQHLREDPDVQRYIGTFWIDQLDRLLEVDHG